MKLKYVLLSVVLGLLTYILMGGFDFGQRFVGGTTILIGSLWISEGFDLSTTALLIPVFMAISGIMTSKEALAPFFDPIIGLMFGGFVLAKAVNKYGIDKLIAEKMISIFPKTQRGLLLAIILATCLISFLLQTQSRPC